MPPELRPLANLLARGLARTATCWPPIVQGYRYVHQAAAILKNAAGEPGRKVRRRLRGLLGAIARHQPAAGSLAQALRHFGKVTGSYWPGLFHCYDVPDLPRTNNDLEHLFGSNRYHERRATGRKAASPAMVLRGPVRLLAATATRDQRLGQSLEPATLAPTDLAAWRGLRQQLDRRRAARQCRCRFRRNPAAYLQDLEAQGLKLALPP